LSKSGMLPLISCANRSTSLLRCSKSGNFFTDPSKYDMTQSIAWWVVSAKPINSLWTQQIVALEEKMFLESCCSDRTSLRQQGKEREVEVLCWTQKEPPDDTSHRPSGGQKSSVRWHELAPKRSLYHLPQIFEFLEQIIIKQVMQLLILVLLSALVFCTGTVLFPFYLRWLSFSLLLPSLFVILKALRFLSGGRCWARCR